MDKQTKWIYFILLIFHQVPVIIVSLAMSNPQTRVLEKWKKKLVTSYFFIILPMPRRASNIEVGLPICSKNNVYDIRSIF